jgi:hypothetical protein
MGENKPPGVIKRLGVRTGAMDCVAMIVVIGYTLNYVKLAVVKRR